MRFYLFHQGTPRSHSYSLHTKAPKVQAHTVRDLVTRQSVTLYQTPTRFLLNFCVHGIERALGLGDMPLGAVAAIRIEVDAVTAYGPQQEYDNGRDT